MSVMYANELDAPAPLSERPLEWRQAAKPDPADGEILIEVAGCGVCRSNLHMIEGEWVDAGVPAISPSGSTQAFRQSARSFLAMR
jgi:alcohol dehydrogenase, propanol-preferring